MIWIRLEAEDADVAVHPAFLRSKCLLEEVSSNSGLRVKPPLIKKTNVISDIASHIQKHVSSRPRVLVSSKQPARSNACHPPIDFRTLFEGHTCWWPEIVSGILQLRMLLRRWRTLTFPSCFDRFVSVCRLSMSVRLDARRFQLTLGQDRTCENLQRPLPAVLDLRCIVADRRVSAALADAIAIVVVMQRDERTRLG